MFWRICFLVVLTALIPTSKSSGDHKQSHVTPCEEFMKGNNSFNESQVIGSWYRLNKTKEVNKIISPVGNEERKNIKARYGNLAKSVNWDLLTSKLELSCNIGKDENGRRIIYLEQDMDNGTYISVAIHKKTEKDKETLATVSQKPTALRIIDGEYQALLDCGNRFVFQLVYEHDPSIIKQLKDEANKYNLCIVVYFH